MRDCLLAEPAAGGHTHLLARGCPAVKLVTVSCVGGNQAARAIELVTGKDTYPVFSLAPTVTVDLPSGQDFEYSYAIFSGGVLDVRSVVLRLPPCSLARFD